MNSDRGNKPAGDNRSDATLVDSACDRFERAWRSGQKPRIRDFLTGVPEQLQGRLFQELLCSELELRSERGDTIDPTQYLAEFSGRSDQVEAAFRQIAANARTQDHQQATENSDATPSSWTSQSAEGQQCGSYRLIHEIARGGMGVVFKAYDKKLQRTVALKMILDRNLASTEAIQRFYAEAEMAAGLDHPGIVPVFDVGSHDDHHFYVMGYVEGPTLAQDVKDRTYSPQESARLIIELAQAVHYAHQHDVVHRDLKPGNVLLCKDGQARITDFGLAKRTNRPSSLTMAGQILGTPGYMSPEQAAGAVDQTEPAVDIYALGAILYHLLTGHPPFESTLDALVQILQQDPIPPRVLNRQIPRDLDVICMKCLSRDPSQRYASARELAEDLQRYLDGELIAGRPPSIRQRILRWARHRPRLASVLAIISAVYAYHLICYWMENPGSQGFFHWLASGTLLVVGAYAWLYQSLLLRSNTTVRILFAWAATDIIVFTWFLLAAADGVQSPLVVLYLCMVAGSALSFDRHMVWLVTIASVVAYSIVVMASPWAHPLLPAPSFVETAPITISLLAIGMIQYFVLRCMRHPVVKREVVGSADPSRQTD